MNTSYERARGPRYTREQIRTNRIKAATGVAVASLLLTAVGYFGSNARTEAKLHKQRSALEAERGFLVTQTGRAGEVSALNEAIVLKPGVRIYSTDDLKQQLQSGRPTTEVSYGHKAQTALLIVEPVEPIRTFEKGVESWWYGFTFNAGSAVEPAFDYQPGGTIYWVEATALTNGDGELAYPQSAINFDDSEHPYLNPPQPRRISIDPGTNNMYVSGHHSDRVAVAHAFDTYSDAERGSVHAGFAA